MSCIDSPNVKGLGCGFVPQGVWQPYTYLLDLFNMPNYGLVADTAYCAPVAVHEVLSVNDELLIFPNPATNYIEVKMASQSLANTKVEMYNSVGQIVYSTSLRGTKQTLTIDVSGYAKGMYYLRCGGEVRKVVVE